MSEAATFEDAFNLLCGELLGEGIHRKVFECKLRPELVVKVEQDERRYFANVFEERFWTEHEHYSKVAAWLAPCEFLSPDGRLLLQRRVDPLPSGYELPERVPSFVTDMKRSNFGLLDGRLVSVDYSMFLMNPSTRLKKADWCDH